MIEVQRVVNGNLTDFVRNSTVEVAGHWCNCFHQPDTQVYLNLDLLTRGAARMADVMDSEKGDINKLGTYTDCEWSPSVTGEQPVRICNLYVSYTLPTPGMSTTHSLSVFNALQMLISEMESGQVLAIPDLKDSEELDEILNTLASDYESELPDIKVMVIE